MLFLEIIVQTDLENHRQQTNVQYHIDIFM